ncbi:MAG TPA: hypothetical protein VIJ01_12980 [Candidatus Angelobacter sp.]
MKGLIDSRFFARFAAKILLFESSSSLPVSPRGIPKFSKKSEIARSLNEMGMLLRWTITYLLIALAAGVMTFNKMTVCSWMRRKNPAATISIVGGCLGAAGCLVSPDAWMNKLWWLPTALDIIGSPYLLVVAWIGIERWLKRRKEAISN